MGNQSKTFDLIVVGAGNAALCSAIAAKENGADVLVLERGSKQKRGGNSFFTDGAMRFAYQNKNALKPILPQLSSEDFEKIDMPEYQASDYLQDMMKVTEGKSAPELAEQLVEKSYETIQWMQKQGVKFELNENQSFLKDRVQQFWGGLPVKTQGKGIGLVEALFNKLASLGVDIRYHTRAVQIEMTNNKVSGIIVEEQGEIKVIPTKSIVLACGGFEANKEKRIKYLGEEWGGAIVRGSEFNTGDGLDMAVEAGAQPYGDWSSCHAHTTDFQAPEVGDYKKPGDIYKKSSYPLGLIVNMRGERFVDEGADFRNYTYAKYGKETLKQPEQKAFQLFDERVRPLLRTEYNLEEATCLQADSIEALVEKMGVDRKRFLETISQYNEAVQEGEYNPSVKDGKGTSGIVPPKSNWALPFDRAPFYAYPVTCGITFTFGGIQANKNSEVLDKNQAPIPGLFAAGEMIGGLFYRNYPGGSGLMSGAVFGRTAGESAAKYIHQISEKMY
ncbi:FAD-dependent tricarballylate dehydrogenase TcuA [Oceanobacillus sp. CFH 90083]|uniref:FAD-dependent tricarballylate dehydrogenase TcuA n=1 Tax=Oceanobacillus sp. CFH 90083 TaxID=2592336 RepID=UPI00128E0B69|nr:FAD-dependent tricarballylate dehydrogenase TcuA [Oceanobacillus sp. CFH 90083]